MKLHKWSDIKKRRFSKSELKEIDLKVKQKLLELEEQQDERSTLLEDHFPGNDEGDE